jgi:hypothetical protein
VNRSEQEPTWQVPLWTLVQDPHTVLNLRIKIKFSYLISFVFNDLRRAVIFGFVDIVGFVDHLCLHFPFNVKVTN